MTAAAVSSIERRVTSITGQEWRVNSRRDLDELGIDGVAVDIGRLTVFVEGQQAAAADLGDALGAAMRPITSGPSSFRSSPGGARPGTSGMLAVLMPRLAR